MALKGMEPDPNAQ